MKMVGIYKITNNINGKVYIGQSVHMEVRWSQHKSNVLDKNKNTNLYKAMREFGIDNFNFEIIEQCTSEELNEREIYWIKQYNSYNDGYNMTPGGQQGYFDPQIFYDLWDQGLCVSDIQEKLRCSPTTIASYLKGYNDYNASTSHQRGGHKVNSTTPFGKKIKQYSLSGEFIKEWDSCKQIQRELKINAQTISRVIKGTRKTAGGYQWCLDGEEEKMKDISKHNNAPKPVLCYDLNNNFIKEYPTIAAAAREMGCDSKNIKCAILGTNGTNSRMTACGYIWKYKSV